MNFHHSFYRDIYSSCRETALVKNNMGRQDNHRSLIRQQFNNNWPVSLLNS